MILNEILRHLHATCVAGIRIPPDGIDALGGAQILDMCRQYGLTEAELRTYLDWDSERREIECRNAPERDFEPLPHRDFTGTKQHG